jgi:surfactin synthase thioesterase subunit
MKKLILLSGLDGTGRLFQPFIEALPSNIEAVVISYPTDKNLAYEALTQYVLKKLPKDEPYFILAESFSGYIAYSIGLTAPKGLQSIIFVATFLENPRPILSYFKNVIPLEFLLSLPMPSWVAKKLLLGHNIKKPMLQNLLATLSSLSGSLLAFRIREITKLKKAEKELLLPCCYIQAKNDKLVPSSALKVFRKQIPNLTVKSLKGSHLIVQSQVSDVVEIVLDLTSCKTHGSKNFFRVY